MLLVSILLPFVSGVLINLIGLRSKRFLMGVTLSITVLTSVLCWICILGGAEKTQPLIRFAPNLELLLSLDGLGKFFTGLVATLWPLTVLYAFSYMEEEQHLRLFFGFFTLSYSATLGISMAGNLFTMYCFYELLTLSTVPLIIHPMTKEAIRATRNYLLYSIGGAAFAFAAMMFLITHNASGPFAMGGVLKQFPYGKPEITRLFWLFGFLGFGVKAAIFPSYKWLPDASVAPTPVTALLHAVAVVKAGAFAVIRLTYYCFGTNMLSGSWAQTTAVLLTAFTIVFGSTFALKETNFKRRLAYSTVANMSYILFGAVLLTPSGLEAGLMHMAAHSCIKILAFFAAGAVLHMTGRQSIYELDGIGKRMPVTFACYTMAALALTGIPPFSGFVSKWYLLTGAAQSGGIAYVGAAAILISALLTAIYMLTIVRRAWFADQNADLSGLPEVKEADWKMLVPMLIFALGTLFCGIFSQPILDVAGKIARGLI